MAGWTTLRNLYIAELQQRREEGVRLDEFLARHPDVPNDQAELNALYDELMALPVDPSFPYDEPDEYEAILAARPAAVAVPQKEIPFDKFYGAWLGRCIGCALGKPLETGWGFTGAKGKPGWEVILDWFKGADAFPIRGYTPGHSRAEQTYEIEAGCPLSQRENIQFMESDDDIRYTVLGHKMMKENGKDFTTMDMGNMWLMELPYYEVCTAERQAYMNLPQAQEMLETGSTMDEALNYTRTFRNPYREFIGEQIRVDGFAYAAAGRPELAAWLGYKDAALSHVKNGVYGEMLCGAMIAASFVESDPERIVEIGLSQIPANCRLAEAVRKAVEIAKGETDQVELVRKIWDAFCQYDGVHTINNAALCAAALVFSKGDFTTAITTAVLGGWDTDCNGATVGSMIGAIAGAQAIPAFWKEPLHDTLKSNIFGYHPIAISECAKQSMEINARL